MLAYTTRKYIPDYVYMGASELDTYGHWVEVDTYGPAWVPYGVGPGWSPYWEGRWCYRPFWGWTWVSYEPWGWLPYHYGRWYHSAAFGWCWLPGAAFTFNFWSPGLVRFYTGPGWVSWCALGPHDYYNVNHYYYSRVHAYQLNDLRLLQTRGPDDLFNRHVTGAFRTVRTDHFVGSSLGGRGRDVTVVNVERPWSQGKIVTDRLGVQPTSVSYAPAPDRPVVRPGREARLPAVIRSEPSVRTERTVRITNPNVTPLPAARLDRGEAGSGAAVGRGAQTPGRIQVVNPSGVDSGRRQTTPAAGSTGRATAPPGFSGSAGRVNQAPPAATSRDKNASTPASGNEASRGRAQENPRSNQTARPQTNAPRRTESAPAPRIERTAPERKQEPARERKEPKPRPNSSDAARGYSSASYASQSEVRAAVQGARVVPFGGAESTYSARTGSYQSPPRPEPQAYSAPTNSRGGGYAAPSIRSSAAASPLFERGPSSSAPSGFREGSVGGALSRGGSSGGGFSRSTPSRAPSGAPQGGGRRRSR
jgi:hypothetical protein